MGTCVCCGKEAKHIYFYYVGEKIDAKEKITDWKNINDYTITTTTTYKNVVRQVDYICTKCSANLLTPSLTIVISAVLLMLIAKFVSSPSTVGIFGLLFILLIITGIISLVRNIVYRIMDKEINDEEGAKMIIYKLKEDKTTNKNITYFTPNEYQKLK